MGSALGHILANVIMTELENKILKVLIESGKLKFYMRHADDTLLLTKEDDIKYIFDMFSTFHKNLKFTMNRFEENNVHSLDIKLIILGKKIAVLPHAYMNMVHVTINTYISIF